MPQRIENVTIHESVAVLSGIAKRAARRARSVTDKTAGVISAMTEKLTVTAKSSLWANIVCRGKSR